MGGFSFFDKFGFRFLYYWRLHYTNRALSDTGEATPSGYFIRVLVRRF